MKKNETTTLKRPAHCLYDSAMQSYQHSYHAGSLADVHKHMALTVALSKLIEKDKPLTYMETHAGRGFYDLTGYEAEKTGEAKKGIMALSSQDIIPMNHPYKHCLDTFKKTYGNNYYPGSPALAQMILRAEDQLHLMEIHPQEYSTLKNNLTNRNVHIHKRDGYEGVLAISPPAARRGLVLIDPSYEIKTEYLQVARFVSDLEKKWPQTSIMVWYPLLKAAHHVAMLNTIKISNREKSCHSVVVFTDPATATGIYGSGLLLLNCPFGIEVQLKKIKHLLTPAAR